MGVRVIETPDANDSYDDEDCSQTCWTTSHASETEKEYFYQEKDKKKSNFQHCAKDIIGNAKEFRIEHNSKDLRIIGNNNRIRIASNLGNLQIIGNNTKLKILSNCGHIKYTGNDGRIYLGSDSQQQIVDYIGCNGVLKVVKSSDLTSNDTKSGSLSNSKTKSNKSPTNNEIPRKPKFKSASFGGGPTTNNPTSGTSTTTTSMPNWQKIHNLFQSKSSRHSYNSSSSSSSSSSGSSHNSMPNLNFNGGNKEKKFFEIKNNITIMDNAGGNIIINNSVNVNV